MKNLIELYSAFNGKSFESYLTKDNKIMVQKELNGKWKAYPNTNSGNDVNIFYTYFPEGLCEKSLDLVDQKLNMIYG